jgi:outer membrane protein assembly factor BamB/tRNA A-37 threonylcarbamoyl transferase component Bud32
MPLIKKVGTKGLVSPGTVQPEDSVDQAAPEAPGTKLNLAQPAPAEAPPPTVTIAPSTRLSPTPGTRAPADAPRALPQATLLANGSVLQGRYVVEGQLGIGGMSVVYRGRDLRFKDVVRQCAIKEMYQSAPDSQTRLLNLKNFEREAGLLATLNHPAIPKVYDFFEENGKIYLILELIAGKDLETVLDEAGGPLDEARVARWMSQICDVLGYLHTREQELIVFRDMKPSNVMLTADERIVLIDFGIARVLNTAERKGTMIGTEGYSPPEQYRGVVEPRSDIYALGATMHHLLTASDPRMETPFTFHERMPRLLNPQLSPEVEAIIVRALEYDVAARWASAAELKEALLRLPALAGLVSSGPMPAATGSGLRPRSTSTELVWSFTCEDEVRSSPCVRDGTLYIGCYDTNLYALDARRGEFRWKYATNGGIASSPAVWQDMVMVGSEDGALYALETRRGHLRWAFRTERAVRSSPRIEDRVVYVGSDDQHVYAIDSLRGTMIWKYRSWMPIRSSAAISSAQIYIGGNDGHLYCLDTRSGNVKWKQKTQQAIVSSPALGEGLVYVGSQDGYVYALDIEGGWPAWRFRTGHYVNSSPYLLGTRVFVGSVDGFLYALDAKSGKLLWKYDSGSQVTASPRVEGGRVYCGDTDGRFYALDAGTGELIWRFEAGAPLVSSPTVADGIVYVGCMNHQVYALKA